jgi:hypothetical protein
MQNYWSSYRLAGYWLVSGNWLAAGYHWPDLHP